MSHHGSCYALFSLKSLEDTPSTNAFCITQGSDRWTVFKSVLTRLVNRPVACKLRYVNCSDDVTRGCLDASQNCIVVYGEFGLSTFETPPICTSDHIFYLYEYHMKF